MLSSYKAKTNHHSVDSIIIENWSLSAHKYNTDNICKNKCRLVVDKFIVSLVFVLLGISVMTYGDTLVRDILSFFSHQ